MVSPELSVTPLAFPLWNVDAFGQRGFPLGKVLGGVILASSGKDAQIYSMGIWGDFLIHSAVLNRRVGDNSSLLRFFDDPLAEDFKEDDCASNGGIQR